MQFLSPWFLIGLLAVAAPIAAHLRRMSVQKRVAFSAVEFLDPKPPRTARRRWEDIALLLARIAVLAFFCVAFARPYFRSTSPEAPAGELPARITVLVDTSASMRRGDLMADARRAAARILEKTSDRDEVELWGFDRSARTVLSTEAWNQTPFFDRAALVQDALKQMEPGWRSTRLDEALRTVAEQLAALPDSTRKEVWVVSDFQEGSSLAGLRGIQWPKKMRVHAAPVEAPPVDPAQRIALHWMPPDPHTASSDAPWKFQVQADPEFRGENVGLVAQTTPPLTWSAPVTPGKVRTTTAPLSAGSYALVRLADGDAFGRSVWVARPPEKRAVVAVFGGGDPKDRAGARYFFERGLLALGSSRVELVAGESWPVERDVEISLWVSLGGGDASGHPRIRAAVERGALALLVMVDRADGDAMAAFAGEPWKTMEAVVDGFTALGSVDRQHPAFAAFRTTAFSDFSGIRFWRHRRLELPAETKAQVVARFEGGIPAAVDVPLGKGHALVWTSGWRPADAQWVLSSRAVPFLSSCLDWALGGRQPFVVSVPGDTVVLPEGVQGARSMQGEWLEAREGRVVLENPGVYVLEPGGGVVVVNVAREENNTVPLAAGKLAALGVPLIEGGSSGVSAANASAGADASVALLAQDLEARQSVWRWVLIGVIFLLGIETFWSGRLSKNRRALP